MKRAYKYRIYPTDDQKKQFDIAFNANRWFWNYCLEESKKEYENTGRFLFKSDLQPRLPKLKKEEGTKWLAQAEAYSFLYTLNNFDDALKKVFKKQGGFPKFKSKQYSNSYTHNVAVKQKTSDIINWSKGTVNLGKKIGDVKVIFHRRFYGQVKRITISKKSYDFYEASFLVDDNVPKQDKKKPTLEGTIGIDMGIKADSNAIFSNGTTMPTINVEKEEKHLKKLKHELSKKKWIDTGEVHFSKKYNKNVEIKKPSKNYIKLKDKIAKIEDRIKRQRNYNTHQISSTLMKDDNIDTIAIEDLNVKGMVKNHHLASKVCNANMYELKRQLTYKSDWYGKNLVQVGRFYPSSQICSNCGYKFTGTKDLSVRDWICPKCGTHHDRDVNAAVNIKKEGYRILSEGKQK